MDLIDFKQQAHQLVVSFPFTGEEFFARFKENYGFGIPFVKLGFDSIDGFLATVPDVVSVEMEGKRLFRPTPRDPFSAPADLPPEPRQSQIQLARSSIQDTALLNKSLFLERVVGLLEKVGRESTKDALILVYRSHFGAEFTSDAMIYFGLHCFADFAEFFKEKIAMYEFSADEAHPIWIFRLKEAESVPAEAPAYPSILSPPLESSGFSFGFQPNLTTQLAETTTKEEDTTTGGAEEANQFIEVSSAVEPICHRDSVKPGMHSTPKMARTCPGLNLDSLAFNLIGKYGMLEPVVQDFPEKLKRTLVAAPGNRMTLDALCVVFRRKHGANFVTAMKDALGAFSQRQIKGALKRYQMDFGWEDDWYFSLKADRSPKKANNRLSQLETITEQPNVNQTYEEMTILAPPSSPSPPTPPRLPPPPPPSAFVKRDWMPVYDRLAREGDVGSSSATVTLRGGSSTTVPRLDSPPSEDRMTIADRLALEFGIGTLDGAIRPPSPPRPNESNVSYNRRLSRKLLGAVKK